MVRRKQMAADLSVPPEVAERIFMTIIEESRKVQEDCRGM
ncbi:MAG: hypothetical protein ACOCWQ_01770 [Nanoarchaeota archaeon]